MASTLIQTFDLNASAHSDAVKLGDSASSYSLDLEVHADYLRLVGSFVVSATTALPANQDVVNITEVIGSDITFSNTLSVPVSGYAPGAMPNDDPASESTGLIFTTPDGLVNINASTSDNTWPINTIVTLDVKFPLA